MYFLFSGHEVLNMLRKNVHNQYDDTLRGLESIIFEKEGVCQT